MSLIKYANNFFLLLLVFSVTFENWDPFKLAGSYSVTYIASAFYFLTWIPLLGYNFNFKFINRYLIPLLLFIYVGLVSTALHSGYAEELKEAYNYRVLLLIILMGLIANHIRSNPTLISRVLNAYLGSVLLMFILATIGAGTSYEHGRLLLFGENPNMIGMKAAIAFLIVLARLLDVKFSLRNLLISSILSVPFVSLVILSASRGALLSLLLGTTILIYFKKSGLIQKIILVVIGISASFFFISQSLDNNPVLKQRMLNTIEKGDTGRNDLWKGAIDIIENNVLIGVGFSGVLPEMYIYSGRYIDPHNVFFYVLISTGIIGFIFFMLFLVRLFRDLYKSYQFTGQTVYMVILIIILFNMAKAGGGIGKILFWFFFAILIGSTILIKQDSVNSKKVRVG
ncbi:O-antigen ligase family protein [Robiginitalea marina]|uniref:O-antigen ligase family protein n=1 Tax=Robiginitalea marina TaxID=2954105 RepID=A0ABT1AVW4_9FLAO|nr:O-antigen ligase family protein [Robiginitalea marina]MCO5723328.1 O-antigen ligase family protein [Robiginitalea marina]